MAALQADWQIGTSTIRHATKPIPSAHQPGPPTSLPESHHEGPHALVTSKVSTSVEVALGLGNTSRIRIRLLADRCAGQSAWLACPPGRPATCAAAQLLSCLAAWPLGCLGFDVCFTGWSLSFLLLSYLCTLYFFAIVQLCPSAPLPVYSCPIYPFHLFHPFHPLTLAPPYPCTSYPPTPSLHLCPSALLPLYPSTRYPSTPPSQL